MVFQSALNSQHNFRNITKIFAKTQCNLRNRGYCGSCAPLTNTYHYVIKVHIVGMLFKSLEID